MGDQVLTYAHVIFTADMMQISALKMIGSC